MAQNLRVEHLDEPLGLGVAAPRLSWRLPDGAREQQAHQLRGTVEHDGAELAWSGEPIARQECVLTAWPGPQLASYDRVTWQVKTWTDLGESDWSAPHTFEVGLLDEHDWQVPWIRPAEGEVPPPTQRPAYQLRSRLTIDGAVKQARLYVSAHGIYEGFLNGTRIGDAELTPGFTQYSHHVQYQTFDVTALLHQGANALGFVLADGWFRGQNGIVRVADQWGTRTALLAQLRVRLADGSVVVLGTGSGWRSTPGPVQAADLIAGESVDLRAATPGWTVPDFDDETWDPAPVDDLGHGALVASPAPPVRRVEEIAPVSVRRLAADRHVVDLGQNINGWVRLRRLGAPGSPVVLTHGEHLDESGDVTLTHLEPDVPFLGGRLPAGQVDRVVAAGRAGEVFEPRRTTHGFRFVRVEGLTDDLSVDDVRGVVVHTDARPAGRFACSDPRLVALHDAAVWSLRGNLCDIPTDCPQRERAGWTGDWQTFVATASFVYDVAGVSQKWLRDVVADQWHDGTIANMSPMPPAEGRGSRVEKLNGSAGWGDAVVIVPWELYRAYGDVQILDEVWPAMVGWLDRAERTAREQRHPDRAMARPVPAPHEEYLWDAGFHWGEWLAPGEEPTDFPAFIAADKGDVATAYLAHSARLMSRIAAVTGRHGDVERYRRLADGATAAWQAEYVGADGRLTPDTQANHVRALAFELVPHDLRPRVADQLVTLVEAAGTHVGTGFLATPDLLPVLADTGRLDAAYALLLQERAPSWLAMLARGATTMWERWDGVDEKGHAHEWLNHYSRGVVISFLHRYVVGLDVADDGPGYRRFTVRPRPGGGLTWAQASHECPYGTIDVRWDLTYVDGDDAFTLALTVPPGTSAEVHLPDGSSHLVAAGAHHFSCPFTTGPEHR